MLLPLYIRNGRNRLSLCISPEVLVPQKWVNTFQNPCFVIYEMAHLLKLWSFWGLEHSWKSKSMFFQIWQKNGLSGQKQASRNCLSKNLPNPILKCAKSINFHSSKFSSLALWKPVFGKSEKISSDLPSFVFFQCHNS